MLVKESFLQFELWKDCNNGCMFCYNNGYKDVNKIESLTYFIKKLDDINCSILGISGGEFFSGQVKDVLNLFYVFIDKVADLIKTNKIEKFYVNTSLVCNPQEYLLPFIQHLKKLGILQNTMFCTSYDTQYRFNNASYSIWESNMYLLQKDNIKRHIETIITQAYIDYTLNNKHPYEQGLKFGCRQDLLEAHTAIKGKPYFLKHLPKFLPTKESFIKFLKYLQSLNLLDKDFLSKQIRSNTLYFHTNNGLEIIKDRHITNNYFPLSFSDCEDSVEDVVQQFKLIAGN